jgi:hypothetical protein
VPSRTAGRRAGTAYRPVIALPGVVGVCQADRYGQPTRAAPDGRRRLLRVGQRVDHAVLLRLLISRARHPRADRRSVVRLDGPGQFPRGTAGRHPHRPLRAAGCHGRRSHRRGLRRRLDGLHRHGPAGRHRRNGRVPRDGRALSGGHRNADPDGFRAGARAGLRHPVHADERRAGRRRTDLLRPGRHDLGRVVPADLPHRRGELSGLYRRHRDPAQGHG